jgi:hypothetical protein
MSPPLFISALVSTTRVETKIFVFVFSRKFRENLFSLFAKKAYEKLRKNENFRETKFREISRKFAHFRIIFAFRENGKNRFRFNPIYNVLEKVTCV